MKRIFALVMVMIFVLSLVGMSVAELRPLSKIMVLRLATMQKVIAGLALSDFDGVKMITDKFASTVKADTAGLPSEPLKEANTNLEKAIEGFSQAVGKKDPSEIVGKFGGVIAACYGCHAKFRDPK